MKGLEQYRERQKASLEGGGAARLEAQHRKGKLSARERLEILLDAGSFEEMGSMVTNRCTDFGLDNDLI
ncbi:MAG: carboxyl transferase domain-containing protein, partial [Bacteroidota bacterium]